MKFNKRGMSAEFLVALIITLVAGGLIMVTVYNKLSKADEKQAEVICQESIAARATFALQVNTKDSGAAKTIEARIKTVPPLCKTIDKKIQGSRDEIKKQMADKLARCWWMFGEGRYEEILHSSDLYLAPVIFGMDNEPNKCFNCYNLLIDQDEIKDDEKHKGKTITTAEFLDYLWTTPYRQKALSCEGEECVSCTENSDCASGAQCEKGKCQVVQSLNYIQYIQQYAGQGMVVTMMPDIEPRHGYAISILPKTKEKEQTNLAVWGGGIIGTAGFLGIVACTAFTAGICAPAMGILASVTTVGAKIWAVGAGYQLIQGEYRPEPAPPDLQGTALDRGTQLSIESMFKERGYSSIYLSDIQTGQRFCGSGDLAGE